MYLDGKCVLRETVTVLYNMLLYIVNSFFFDICSLTNIYMKFETIIVDVDV